jgi:hypothetical protein
MFITFGNAVGIVVKMMPFLAVMLVIILVLYLLLAFVFNEEKGFVVPYYVKIVGGFVMLAAVIIAVLVATGYWDTLKSMVASGNAWLSTLVFAAIIVGVIVAVVIGSHHDK